MLERRNGRRVGMWLGIAIAAITLVGTGWLGAARASGDDESADDTPIKKKDVRVFVSRDGEDPQVYVSSGGDDEESRGGYLGVSIEEDTKSPEGGARVDSVAEGSPADKAGIRKGDTIVGFGGTVIRGPARLTEKIHATNAGDRVDVKVLRKEGKTETVSVELGERPKAQSFWFDSDSEAPHAIPLPGFDMKSLEKLKDIGKEFKGMKAPRMRYWAWRGDRPRLGVELVETTPELREHLGGSREAGVLVGKVLSNTPAQRSGVKVGDLIVSVDGHQVDDAGALIEALEDKEGKTVEIEVVRDRRTTRVQVAIPKQEEEEDEPTGPRAGILRIAPPTPPPAPPAPPALRKRHASARERVERRLEEVESEMIAREMALAAHDRAVQAAQQVQERAARETALRVDEVLRVELERAAQARVRADAERQRVEEEVRRRVLSSI